MMKEVLFHSFTVCFFLHNFLIIMQSLFFILGYKADIPSVYIPLLEETDS